MAALVFALAINSFEKRVFNAALRAKKTEVIGSMIFMAPQICKRDASCAPTLHRTTRKSLIGFKSDRANCRPVAAVNKNMTIGPSIQLGSNSRGTNVGRVTKITATLLSSEHRELM